MEVNKDLPLSAKVVTTRIAQAPWGFIFKISFENIVSRTKPPCEIGPVYYIVTDDEIVLLNEQDNELPPKYSPPRPSHPPSSRGTCMASAKARATASKECSRKQPSP